MPSADRRDNRLPGTDAVGHQRVRWGGARRKPGRGYSGFFIGPVLVGLASSAGGLSAGFTAVAAVTAAPAIPTLWLNKITQEATLHHPGSAQSRRREVHDESAP